MIRIFLLGGLRIERNGEPVSDSAWRRRPARTLLAMLAAEPAHRLHREAVTERLWPDAPPEAMSERLHSAISAIRRTLEPDLPSMGRSAHIRLGGEMVELLPGHLWIDAEAFEAMARAALAAGKADAHREALALYRGEVLPEYRYDDWAQDRRNALALLHLQLLVGLAQRSLESGEPDDAIVHLQQALAEDPLREDVHRRLMQAHAAAGQRHQALRQYRECARILAEEVGVEPEEETRALYEAIAAGSQADGPGNRQRLHPAVERQAAHPLIGRERSQAFLRRHLNAAAGGVGTVALVSGEAGVGKTRLAAELARVAATGGATVLWGSGFGGEGPLIYGPFVQVIDQYLAACTTAERVAIGREHPELSLLVPWLSGDTEPATAGWSDGNRLRLFTAITRFLSTLPPPGPIVLVLDDLHAAESGSAELLQHLARSAPSRSWLIVATYRPEQIEPGSAMDEAIGTLVRGNLAHRIELLRLSRVEAEAMIRSLLAGGTIDDSVPEQLYRLSQGNPLFLRELVHALVARGLLSQAGGIWRTGQIDIVPPGVAELVHMRVARLDEPAQRIVRLSAVAGMETTFAVLRAADQLPEESLLDALDTALQDRILLEQGGRYTFLHPLFRHAIYEALSAPRRAQLHAIVGAALERVSPGDAEALAHHFMHSDVPARARPYLERAGDGAAAVYAHDAAERYYRDLLRMLDGDGSSEDALRVEEKLGRTLAAMARYDEALAVLGHAAEAHRRAGRADDEARVVASLGRVYRQRAAPDEGIRRIADVLERIDADTDSCLSAAGPGRLHLALTYLYLSTGEYEQMLVAADRTIAQVEAAAEHGLDQAEARSLRAEALGRRGTAMALLARPEEARIALEASLSLADPVRDLELLCANLSNLASLEEIMGALEACLVHRQQSLDLAERMGDPHSIAFHHSTLGGALEKLGRNDEALRCFERARDLFVEIGSSWGSPFALDGIGRMAMVRGDWEAAARNLQEARALAHEAGDLQALAVIERDLAELECSTGRPDLARDRLTTFLAGAPSNAAWTIPMWPQLAEAHLALGAIEEAERIAALGVERALATQERLWVVPARIARGAVLVRRGCWEEAELHLEEATRLAHAMPYPRLEAHALHLHGTTAASRGDSTAARRLLTSALHLARKAGAQVIATDVEAAIRALPASSHP